MKVHLAVSNALAGKLVVVCGPGGVGKTTTAAALALAAAGRDIKTLVCTIDPSKRLRTSLGLARLTGTPQKVKGKLYAMRLDPKQTFDDLVRRHAAVGAADPEELRRLLVGEAAEERRVGGLHVFGPGAVAFEEFGDVGHLVSPNSSRPISQRRISEVPAPIS